jgi:hypothetical protein
MKGIKPDNLQDFRGGLNLRSDPFELADNESPDLLNVDLDPRGGVEQRKGTSIFPVTQANPNLLTLAGASHEGGLGWTPQASASAVSSTTDPRHGSNSMLIGSVAGGDIQVDTTTPAPVLPSATYTAFSYVKALGPLRSAQVIISWFTSGLTPISQSLGTVTALSSTYTPISVTALSPANAAWGLMSIYIIGTLTGETFRADCHHFARGVNPNLWLNPGATTSLDSEVQSLVHYQTTTHSQLVASTREGLWWSNVGSNSWTLLGGSGTTSFVQFKDLLYIVSSTVAWAWDGSTLFPKLGSFNDDLTTPHGDYVPVAKYVSAFQGSVWVANTTESATSYPNRVRFSHPNFPADYRSFDYFDVDTGLDGDVITGLVPFGDRLLIFKRRAVYAVSGTGPDDFQVYPITQEVGAVDQQAIVNTDMGIFFFSWPEGVFLYDGDTVRRQSERIQPIIDEGKVPAAAQSLIRLGWANRRLWVSVPWREHVEDAVPTANTRTFILDPTLTKEGSWTVYDFGAGSMVELNMAANLQFLGASPGEGFLLLLEDPTTDLPNDTLTSGLRRAITSYYRTRWVDLGQPAIKKRWKRPEFVIHSVNARAELPVQLYTDYDPIAIKGRFSLALSQDASVMLWGEPWGETWDLDGQRSQRSEVVRGASLGQARAVQLKINGPDPLSFNLLTEEESRFEGAQRWGATSPAGAVALSSAQAFEGSKSLLVTAASGGSSFGAWPLRSFPVQPGDEMVWSFAAIAKDVTGTVRGAVLWSDASGSLITATFSSGASVTTGSWQVVTLTAVAPPGAVAAVFYVDWFGALTTGQGFYVDNAELYAGDSPVGLAWGLNAIAFKFIPRPVRS